MAALAVLNMRTRTTWLLALATLVAAIVFLREQTDAPEGTRQARLLDSPADITSIQIERPEESLRLVREGSAWLITEPVRAQAEAARVEILLSTLANPGELRAIEPTDAGPGEFGLDPPRAIVRLAVGDRKLPTISLGRRAPVGARAYLRLSSDATILLGSEDIPFAADRGLEDLRSPKVLPGGFSPRKVRLRRPNLPDILVEADQEGWKIREPVDAKADPRAMEEWMEAVRKLEATSFFDRPGPEDLEAYSFSPALLEIIWSDTRGDRRLWVGAPNFRAGDDEIWMRNDIFDSLYSVPRTQIAAIDLTPESLRDKSLLNLDRDEIGAVLVQRRDRAPIRLERTAGRWLANDAPANSAAVKAFLDQVLTLSGDTTLSTVVRGKPFGLDDPEINFTFLSPSGSTLARVLIGATGGTTTATREGSSRIYSLAPQQIAALEKNLTDFR